MPPASLVALAARVEARLEVVIAAEHARWSAFAEDLRDPVGEVARLVSSGGKRLRPAFAYWAFRAAGGRDDDPQIIDAGAALELMHAFALFHDDVMDDAATRRGQQTTHTLFAERHRANGWAGEARRFGEGMAILVGDLAFVYSDQLLAGANRDAWQIWNELRIELNVGQLLDMIGSARNERAIEYCERICRYKSGKYTIERPLHLGATLADPARAARLRPALSDYGLPLGDAFQMRDDVMGAFGDQSVTGKPVGGDLREGKPTPLLARAVAAAGAAQRAVLDRVGCGGLSDDDVAEIQAVIVDTGALADLEATIAARSGEALGALGALADLGVDGNVLDQLRDLAVYVSRRSA